MLLLIDGYNLMFESVASRQGMDGKHALRMARERLMEMLVGWIDESELSQTMIVFDAKDAPKHLPDKLRRSGMQIVFARDWDSADELIQAEIRKHPTPKRLKVVSSDHAIHRKAKARGATVMDSSEWLDHLERQRLQKQRDEDEKALDASSHAETKDQSLTEEEKQKWLTEFGY